MKKSQKLFTYISNAVCFLLLLAMLATQFMPFWLCEDCKNHEEAKMVSAAEYTWFAKKHSPITKGMTEVYLDAYGHDLVDEKGKPFKFQANDTVIPCVVIFAATILAIAMLIKKPDSPLFPIFPLAGGISGAFGYLAILALQQGQNWMLHFIVGIVLTLVAAGTLITHIIKYFRARALEKSN